MSFRNLRSRLSVIWIRTALFAVCLRMALLTILSSIPLLADPPLGQAQNVPPLRVLLLPRLIPDAIRQMLPLTFDSPNGATDLEPQKISVVAMVYCGGESTNQQMDGDGTRRSEAESSKVFSDSRAASAYMIGVAVPGPARALSYPVLSTSDCAAPLANVAARLMNANTGPEWLEVIKLRATWIPWRVTLTIADAAGAAKPGYTAPNLSGLGQIKSYNTSNIRLLTGRGSNVGFDLAVGFPGSAITLIAAPAGRISNPAAYLNDFSVADEIASAPAMSNVIAEAQYTFINQVLRLYGSTFEIPLPVEGTAETMTAKNITVAGADNLMTVAGDLEYRNLDYAASMRSEGDDLTVRQVTLDAPSANCNQDDLMERLQCQGQSVALSGSSNAIANAITQYYQGQPLHVSTRTHPLDFAIGDTDYQATFDALKASSHGGMFSEAGHATVRRAAPGP
jgi:hypothetical protein